MIDKISPSDWRRELKVNSFLGVTVGKQEHYVSVKRVFPNLAELRFSAFLTRSRNKKEELKSNSTSTIK